MSARRKITVLCVCLVMVISLCAGCKSPADKTYTCQGCGDSYTPSENMTQCKSIAKRNLCTSCYASIAMYVD